MRLIGTYSTLLRARNACGTGSLHQTTSRKSPPFSPKRHTSGHGAPKKDVVESESVAYEVPKAFVVGGAAGLLGSLAGMGGGFVMM
jgi:hypothetical protein